MPRYKFYYNVPGTGCVAMQARDAEEAHEKSADNEWDDFMGEDLGTRLPRFKSGRIENSTEPWPPRP